jgi:hypothetical protein
MDVLGFADAGRRKELDHVECDYSSNINEKNEIEQ